MSRFVLKFFFQRHQNDNTLQNENYWNAYEPYAPAGENRLPCLLFPLLVTVS